MSDTHDIDGLTARLRAATAIGLTPVGGMDAGQDLLRWFGEMGALPDSEAYVTITTLDGAFAHATGIVGGARESMIAALGDHLGMVDASDDEVARARDLGVALAPHGVSLWVEADAAGLAVGYAYHGELAIAPALAALPDNDARVALADAIDTLRLDMVSELRTTAGMAPIATFLRLPLSAHADVVAAVDTMAQALDVPAFDASVVTLLCGDGPGAELIVGLNDEGVCAFGVSIDSLTLEAAIGLIDCYGADQHLLAMFEGALGSEGPRGASLWRDAEGERLRFTYAVTRDY